MDLEALSGAATVALTSTIAFLFVAKSWNTVSRPTRVPDRYRGRILHESAQRFRDELARLSRSQSTYLCGTLVFALLFIAAYWLQAERLFAGYPRWQLLLQLAVLSLVFLYAIYHLAKTTLHRNRLALQCNANIAMGHQLQQLRAGRCYVFHDVETSKGTIDHVLAGKKGIYAINVVVRKPGNNSRAELHNSRIHFSTKTADLAITDIRDKNAELQKEFAKIFGRDLEIRSVIAVPGWEIDEQRDPDNLLVNERIVTMLVGWTSPQCFLMNDELDIAIEELRSRCARN